jgi:hypothetical protein
MQVSGPALPQFLKYKIRKSYTSFRPYLRCFPVPERGRGIPSTEAGRPPQVRRLAHGCIRLLLLARFERAVGNLFGCRSQWRSKGKV